MTTSNQVCVAAASKNKEPTQCIIAIRSITSTMSIVHSIKRSSSTQDCDSTNIGPSSGAHSLFCGKTGPECAMERSYWSYRQTVLGLFVVSGLKIVQILAKTSLKVPAILSLAHRYFSYLNYRRHFPPILFLSLKMTFDPDILHSGLF